MRPRIATELHGLSEGLPLPQPIVDAGSYIIYATGAVSVGKVGVAANKAIT